ncbi:MAG: hypothetical protein GXP53_01645 [Deltaproteobacteria bacterium]|nr:hypothetical protein [Deltaproteobacteria bacterium]
MPDCGGSKRHFRNWPWIIAHRGARAEAPENTHAAFEAAIRHGVDGIELDVQLTSDDVPVIFHDNGMSRILGVDRPVSSFSHAELSGFDMGGWFSPDFKGESIPTLESVIDRYADKTILLVEIKSMPQWSNSPGLRKKSALSVTRMIQRMVPAERMDGIYVLSFDPIILDMAHEYAPEIKLVRNLHLPIDDHEILQGMNQGVFACGLASERLTLNFMIHIHSLGLRVMTYSCNTAKEIDRALELGVDMVLTDDPDEIVGHFRERVSALE